MEELDCYTESLINMANSWTLRGPNDLPCDSREEVVSRALRCMARIKLNRYGTISLFESFVLTEDRSARIKIHRYCAFFDTPTFSARYCDLDSKSDSETLCSISSAMSSISESSGSSITLSLSSVPSAIDLLPFNRHHSTKICLESALQIAKAFDDLPFPNPSGQTYPPSFISAPTTSLAAPRLMPALACCGMQCTYVLAMVKTRMETAYGEDKAASPIVDSALLRVRMGFESICALFDNYAMAFEALGGMRGNYYGSNSIYQLTCRRSSTKRHLRSLVCALRQILSIKATIEVYNQRRLAMLMKH